MSDKVQEQIPNAKTQTVATETTGTSGTSEKIGLVDDGTCDSKNTNLFLANMVRVFHTIVVIFILLAPFSNNPSFLILHITFSISLLAHWYANNNECSLTYIESKLRGLDRTKSFTHQFIAPLYDMSKTEWSRICYIVTIVLMCISIYYLYNSEKVARTFQCWKDISSTEDYKSLSFSQRMLARFHCFKDLFVWC